MHPPSAGAPAKSTGYHRAQRPQSWSRRRSTCPCPWLARTRTCPENRSPTRGRSIAALRPARERHARDGGGKHACQPSKSAPCTGPGAALSHCGRGTGGGAGAATGAAGDGGGGGVDGACTSPIDRGALRWGQESRTQTTSFPESRYMTSGSPHSRVEKTSSAPSCSEYAAAYLPAGKVSVGPFVR